MTEYAGLFTQAELDREIANGYVRCNEHPDNSELWILNYTEKAAYEGYWNNVTLNCRGLIIGPFCDIVARPFPKFFNYGQVGCPEIDLDEPAIVTDKMDGSLGILYKNPDIGRYAIATRGSFVSAQAAKATEILRNKYPSFKPFGGWTYLFEIVYPENRIVCDYRGMEDLVFLGAVVIETGESRGPQFANLLAWPGPVAEVFEYQTMREALAAKPREGKEGFVVHLLDSDVRVKIKQEDYIALHRIVTGLNARSVWQAMLTNSLDQLIEQIPDEFHEFIRGVESDILLEVESGVRMSIREFDSILRNVQPTSKKDFAMVAKDFRYSWALFNLWDGKDIYQQFLELAKPAHDYSPVKVSNDAD